jgi:hypothetical protein
VGRRSDLALGREGTARAALAIFDEDGAAAVTLRNIAARLGIQSPSLYNPALARSLSDAELDAVDDRGFALALELFLDGLISGGP